MSMFFAFAALYPDNQVLLFFIIPIKIKWLALLDAAYFAYAIIANAVNGYWFFALMPIVAILNFFIFCGGTLVSYMRRSRFAGYNSNTIKFKSAAKKAKRQNTHNKTKCFGIVAKNFIFKKRQNAKYYRGSHSEPNQNGNHKGEKGGREWILI